MNVAAIIFWFSVFAIAYTYIGYMLLLHLLPVTRETTVVSDRSKTQPSVTMVIAAYNEQTFIRAKVENALAADYPDGAYFVVVVSDGSDDATNTIVSKFDDERLTFVPIEERGGKASALNRALQNIRTDYVVFTDANVFLEADAIRNLVQAAESTGVGAVTGRVELESLEEKEPLGESVYMRYERYIQSLESRFWSVVGVDGGLFIVRRELVCEIPDDTVLDDFTVGINVAMKGSRVCYQPTAIAVEQVPAEVSQEFRRKTRIAAGCFQLLSRLDWKAFWRSPTRYQFAFVSHKLIRWYVPLFLILAFCSNVLLFDKPFYRFTLIVQVLFYCLAIAATLIPALRQMKLSYIAYYFVAMNLAFLAGWYRQKRDRQSVIWNRVDR